MPFDDLIRVQVTGAGCSLSVVTSGPEDGPAMILIHGMRDHALSMLFLSSRFPEYRLIAPDLRGHGDSDKPGVYGLLQFVADLKSLYDHFQLESAVLVGHSLGGHIAARFSSLYPEKVTRLIMLDGMGPPGASDEETESSPVWRIEEWHRAVEAQMMTEAPTRVMADLDEALLRFERNNPKIADDRARLLVETGTSEVAGGIAWKWDSRVDMIWTTFSHAESEAALSRIQCPVLLVTGEYSMEYWTDRRERLVGEDAFYESELQRRESLFRDATRIVIWGAGHMLHYDQPDALAVAMQDFLNQLSAESQPTG